MTPAHDEGEHNNFMKDGHSSAPTFDYRASGAGFDHRMNDDDPLSSSYGANMNYDEEVMHKSANAGVGFEVGYLPPDQRPGLPAELLTHLVDTEIADDTEAAAALRANASVKVGKVGKVARSVGVQSVRKVAKRLTLRGQSGNRRGKPPRIPPGMTASQFAATAEDAMLAVQEADDMSMNSEEIGLYLEDQQAHDTGEDSHPIMISDVNMAERFEGEGSKSKRLRHSHMEEGGTGKDIPVEVVAATMDAGRKLMGAIDPHNMLQLQRWRRKNKKGKRDKRKSYVKGKVIDGRHELYTLSIAVMLGVRTSIARTNTIIASSDRKKVLTPQDFMAEEKYEFAPKGSATTPPHKLSHTFKFKDYAPVAFAYLRRMFGVNEFDFLLSVCGNANFIEFISNAKSGQFFFYSSDGKYMIKTMTNAESKFLRRILPHYFRHCTQNPNTLITKFLGMYRVKLYHLRRNVKFVIMNSVYYTDKSLQTFYDLKGSEIGRAAKPGQDVLKDNDLRAKLPEEAFNFETHVQERVRAQVASDCRFLRQMQIMDYSMLIGIHHIPPHSDHDSKKNITETGFRIKERQHSHQSQQSDPMRKAAAHVHEQDNNGMLANGYPAEAPTAEEQKRQKLNDSHDLSNDQGDSTRKLISDIRESTFTGKNFEFAGLFEEEDDCSYLEGSEAHKKYEKTKHAHKFAKGVYDDIELKKEQTVEQIYWPFHRFFDINGYRRMKPKPCFRCNTAPCTCDGDQKIVRAWKIPDFVPPLSDRKDGGIMMDTTGLKLPMTVKGPQGEHFYEGKIYFMGIIDILQQYNARKRVETSYRRMESRKGLEPSCVSPHDYAERFIQFFDEYSGRARPKTDRHDENTEVEVRLSPTRNDDSSRNVDIVVSSSANSARHGDHQ